jgi:DNA-directed RNA polymerase subunit RPC12/RpoP
MMKCAKCNSELVVKIPASEISRNPGWRCNSCGMKMRYSESIIKYVAILALGILIFLGLGIPFLLSVIEVHNPGTFPGIGKAPANMLPLSIIGVIVAVWSLLQIRKPAPIFEDNKSAVEISKKNHSTTWN